MMNGVERVALTTTPRRFDADQPDHRHRRQLRQRIELDRQHAVEIAVDKQHVAIRHQRSKLNLSPSVDDRGDLAANAELGERRLQRAFPARAFHHYERTAALEVLNRSEGHDFTSLNNGERIAAANRGEVCTRYGSGAIGSGASSSTSN
jgi:hypothetical protein